MGVLDGVRVLDLSWGIAGPIATMLLAGAVSIPSLVLPGIVLFLAWRNWSKMS